VDVQRLDGLATLDARGMAGAEGRATVAAREAL
jgi:hypothetical protein